MTLNERELVKLLHAKIELIEYLRPELREAARNIVRDLSPYILKLIRQEVAAERRK